MILNYQLLKGEIGDTEDFLDDKDIKKTKVFKDNTEKVIGSNPIAGSI